MERKFTDDEIVNKKGNMNMSCTPWSNEKERADYYENLYKEQFAEIERLEVELKAMRGAANSYKAECERLREAYALYEETTGLKWARAEAIKEFAERLKEREQWEVEYREKIIFTSEIDNLVKEMTGEHNG